METIFNKLLSLKWVLAFKSQTVPRWMVLFADLGIVTFCYILLAMSDVFSSSLSLVEMLRNWAIVIGVYLLMILFTKTHTSIIRLSVIEDLYRVFKVVALSAVLLIGINFAVHQVFGLKLMHYWSIVILGAISFSFLVIERLAIKHIYSRLTHAFSGRQRVLVLGTSISSLILATALKNELDGKFNPIGLLAEKDANTPDEINGFKVYPYNEETLVNTFVENGIHALIFHHDKAKEVGLNYADFFIKNNLRILSFNRVEEFDTDHSEEKEERNISTYVKEVQIEDLLGREPIVLNNSLVRSNIRDSVVLVTGACGSIGSEIVKQIASYKAKQIVLVDQAETPMHDLSLEMKNQFPNANVVLFMGDVQNRERMELAFATYRPKFVFHAAAYKHVPMMEINPTEAVLTNVMGTKNIADLALKYGVYKFVMVSTDKAVNPTNVMGCTKRLSEIYTQSLYFNAKQKGKITQFITTRFGNVLGSNGSVIPRFRDQIQRGGPVTVTHPEIIRYFMTIPEACRLVLEAGSMGHGGEIYIFDMGKPVKIVDLARRMISLSGRTDVKIEFTGLRHGEKLYEELLNIKELTKPTHHEKIMIAKVREYDYDEVKERIQHLIEISYTYDQMKIVAAMKDLVPEFISKNSIFESLDKK